MRARIEYAGVGTPRARPVGGVIELRIPGTPRGQERPRFAQGRMYTPRKTELAQAEIVAEWKRAGEPRLPDDAALAISLVLGVERPQSHYTRNGALSSEGLRHPIPRNRKPDLDNALKLAMDALNGRAYRDDVQVAEVVVIREWALRAETVISLYLAGEVVA